MHYSLIHDLASKECNLNEHNISKLKYILFFRYFMLHKTMFGMISDWGIMAPSWRPPKLYLLPILNKKTKFCYTTSGVKMSEIQTIFKVALNVQRKEKILFWMCMHVRKKKPSELLLLLHTYNFWCVSQFQTSQLLISYFPNPHLDFLVVMSTQTADFHGRKKKKKHL